MAYKVSDNDVIRDSKATVFKSVIVGVHEDFAPLGPVQGETSGYTSGGQSTESSPTYFGSNIIDKFPFASDANATDVGDLTETSVQRQTSGSSSSSNGYVAGGEGTFTYPVAGARTSVINKFPFSVDQNASNIGDLAAAVSNNGGNSSETHGYSTGGSKVPSPPGPPYIRNEDAIQKYSFSSDGNASDVANLLSEQIRLSSQNSPTHGYASGGESSNVIQKFTFASDANATDVGDLLSNVNFATGGNSSLTDGYVSGGSPNVNVIQKFPFSTDANASDVGDLTQARGTVAGQNSGSFGYASGGFTFPPYISQNTIDKFPFGTDANAADVGDLTQARNSAAGQQV